LITEIVYELARAAVSFMIWSILLGAIVSLLLAFNIVDRHNRFIWTINDFLYRITEPLLAPLRRRIPPFNGVDLTPWIALILLQLVVLRVLDYLYAGIRFGAWGALF
jgi:YggT family protein